VKVNASLSSAIRSALGLVGSEWNPELLQSVQPVVVLASEGGISGGSSPSSTESPAYMRSYNYPGAGAVVPTVQLSNPASTNVNVLVEAFHLTASVAGSLLIVRNGNAAPLIGAGFNKDFNGAAGVAEFRSGGLAAVGGDLLMHMESAGAGDRQ
jgi:hypothetical protein